jgi:hypothetical protein
MQLELLLGPRDALIPNARVFTSAPSASADTVILSAVASASERKSKNPYSRHMPHPCQRSVRRQGFSLDQPERDARYLAWPLVIVLFLTAVSLSARAQTAPDDPPPDVDSPLTISSTDLPNTYPHGPYNAFLETRGNLVPPPHWKVDSGTLPPGIRLEDNGQLHGEAERAGEFQFVVSVKDGSQPQQAAQKAFTIKVVEALVVTWKTPAHVTGNKIEGCVEVSNVTPEDLDLTFDVKAVAENGRATEIGYQHFALKRGTIAMALPFGETLPYGAYTIHVNVVGELAKRNAIYRQQMQAPHPLQITVGP